MIISQVRRVPPAAWVAVTAVIGLGVLAYHAYAQDDQDTDWTTAKESQPPMRAPYPNVPGWAYESRPMDPGPAFRSRSYPDSLAGAHFSIIGEF